MAGRALLVAGRALLVAWTVAACCGALAETCAPQQYTLDTRQGTKCCDPCPSVDKAGVPCQGIPDTDCKCGQGYRCMNRDCSECTKTPTCERGQQLEQTGAIHYNYVCSPCPPGTYSDKQNGYCKTWADCESQGLETKEAGTHIHNVKCGFSGMPEEIPGTREYLKPAMESQDLYMTILAILTAVAIFILILGTVFLHLYIWRMKKEKLFVAEDGACSSGNSLIHPLEDSCSFQFPEEEHGGKKAEEAEEDAVDEAWMSLKENLRQ